MTNAWDWHRQCSDPHYLRQFSNNRERKFKIEWWREWRLACLIRGCIVAPAELRLNLRVEQQ